MISFNGLRALLPALAGCLIALSGCGNGPDSGRTGASGKPKVVATIFPLADWTRQIAGPHVDVVTLLPAGASPHTFEPSSKDMRNIADASLFLKCGLHMDDWGGRLANASKGRNLKTVSLGDWLESEKQLPDLEATLMLEAEDAEGHEHHAHDHHHDHEHEGGRNPHFWLDPHLAALCVDKITSELAAMHPQLETEFVERGRKYKDQLLDLDRETSAALSGCRGNGFVSFHDAFPYLAKRYGLRIAAVIEEYPGKTPSDNYVKAVADRLRESKISTVFMEPQLNPKPAEIIAGAVGANVGMLDPYGTESEPARDSYVELIRFNVEALRKALCPARTDASAPTGKP